MYGQVEDLVQQINKFDTYYEMTSSEAVFDKAKAQEDKIKKKLKNLVSFEKGELVKRLNDVGTLNFERYFKNSTLCVVN